MAALRSARTIALGGASAREDLFPGLVRVSERLGSSASLARPRSMKITGPWALERIHAHFETTVVPLRLACVSASGHPQVLSLWYLSRDGALWCATSPRARVVAMLARELRCGFEVARDAPPYSGVRGRAIATLDRARGTEVLTALIDRYQGSRETPLARWLLGRSASEMAIRIEPASLASWDFAERMR